RHGILGLKRARDAGFDLCQFNLHKTFSVPHGCMGGAVGASGVREDLVPFLPAPTVEFDGSPFYLDDPPAAGPGAGRRARGGLRRVPHSRLLSTIFLPRTRPAIRGATLSFAHDNSSRRLEQARY